MPIDLVPALPHAFVELGDGGAHAPNIRFEADDSSCIWNGFEVSIYCCPPLTFLEESYASSQLSSFITTPGAGGSRPTDAEWPIIWIPNVAVGYGRGFELKARFTFNAHGTTSVGSAAVAIVGGAACGSKPGPILGDYDSGFFDTGCAGCAGGEVIGYQMQFTNFSPIGGLQVQIDAGTLEMGWFDASAHLADYRGNQEFRTLFHPPGYVPVNAYDPPAGLYIGLPTDPCGNLSMTYTQLADAIDALDLGITATTLGGHGGDLALPCDCSLRGPYRLCDALATLPDTPTCEMAGADCTGGVNDKGAVIL